MCEFNSIESALFSLHKCVECVISFGFSITCQFECRASGAQCQTLLAFATYLLGTIPADKFYCI